MIFTCSIHNKNKTKQIRKQNKKINETIQHKKQKQNKTNCSRHEYLHKGENGRTFQRWLIFINVLITDNLKLIKSLLNLKCQIIIWCDKENKTLFCVGGEYIYFHFTWKYMYINVHIEERHESTDNFIKNQRLPKVLQSVGCTPKRKRNRPILFA